MATVTSTASAKALLERLGVDPALVTDGDLVVRTPITGEEIARVARTTRPATDAAVARAAAAFEAWRDVPAPRRGELVRLLGEELRREKEALGALVTLEVGKIAQEGLGEVQEMIDICDFAVGLSRQLYGRSIASERPGSPAHGDVAPARAGRRDQRLQLPGRGLELERRARARLRRSGDLEAVRADAADGARDDRAPPARRRRASATCRTGSSSS